MKLSRALAALELILIVLPLTVIAAWGTVVWTSISASMFLDNQRDKAVQLSTLAVFSLIGTCALVAFFGLLTTFIREGRLGLLKGSRLAWRFAIAGALTSLIAGILAVVYKNPAFAAGLPALIPFLHLWQERRHADG